MNALEPGGTLLHYTVVEKIGQGGMGEVYGAVDTRLGRTVAIKVLSAASAADDTARRRLLAEAKAISSLNHPNIVTIHAIESAPGIDFLVMEFVVGRTLREVMAEGGLPLRQLIETGSAVASALGEAHAAGLIHRDVKPANVVMSAEGAILLDFGIARAVIASGTDQLTRSGIAVGTSTYMSPEQITALVDIDHRSDIYSMGCMLFECLAGQPPFHHRNEAVVLQLHLTQTPPDVRSFRSDTPAELATGIAKALAKAPKDRWLSAAEMRDAFAGVTVS